MTRSLKKPKMQVRDKVLHPPPPISGFVDKCRKEQVILGVKASIQTTVTVFPRHDLHSPSL
jgi:hypothetical protein